MILIIATVTVIKKISRWNALRLFEETRIRNSDENFNVSDNVVQDSYSQELVWKMRLERLLTRQSPFLF